MKIKSLSIRNIASIEKADIDFENGLRSFGDSEPASLFLITGETGAGKTVILDCISMALYGTTPRVKGVSGKKNNVFATSDGEEIALTDIAQYTRLGITHRDECFSRLRFEGNDGIEYISTFRLGINNRGRLRTSSWSLQIGESELIEGGRKEEIKNRILRAVGLSYEQFSRMAMLAQGQFAEFLTGGKDERERILEQLTDTGKFSLYGEAISRIFSRARAERESVAKTVAAEQRHILSQEEEEVLRIKERENDNRLADLRKERESVDRILSAVAAFSSAMAGRLECRRRLAEARKRSISEEFRNFEETLRKWDATGESRSLLDRVHRDEAVIRDCTSRLSDLDSVRRALENDLEKREKEYDREGVARTEKEVITLRETAERLRLQREELQPAGIAKEIHAASVERSVVESIQARLLRLINLDKELTDARKNEAETVEKMKAAQAVLELSVREREKISLRAEEAKKRYDTMELSVSENYREMRARLKAEHAEICPLCGQSKDWAKEEIEPEFFGRLLSPLASERDALLSELENAKEREEINRRAFTTASATSAGASTRLKVAEGNVETEMRQILSETLKTSLTPPDSFSEEGITIFKVGLEEKLETITDRLRQLTDRAEKAEKIQKEINDIRKRSLPLEKNLEKAGLLEVALGTLKQMKHDINSSFADQNETSVTHIGSSSPINYSALDLEGITREWSLLSNSLAAERKTMQDASVSLSNCREKLREFFSETGMNEEELQRLSLTSLSIPAIRRKVNEVRSCLKSSEDMLSHSSEEARAAFRSLITTGGVSDRSQLPEVTSLLERKQILNSSIDECLKETGTISARLKGNEENRRRIESLLKELEKKEERFKEWDSLNRHFGGTRFRTLVQSYILRPLLRNANLYLERITDRFTLTCSDENEQLSILVLDRYNKDKVRSATVLSGGEKFMISLALSLALSAMNKGDMNVDILFIDEGFGTLDAGSLNAVIDTLRRLPEIAGQNGRRVGVISHREELADRIDVKIRVSKCGEGRSRIDIEN